MHKRLFIIMLLNVVITVSVMERWKEVKVPVEQNQMG